VSRVSPTPAQITASAPGASFFRPDTLANYVHSAPQEKVGLTANWSLDEFGITFRETYWGPQHSFSTPNNGGELINFNQAGVGLTDLELRYNFTDQLQFAFGGNNIFNIRPDLQPFAGPPVGSVLGNNPNSGVALPAGNGSVSNNPFGAAWNPNGGYYYGRINFNF
jgi:iron complex outermembrane receptor protein